MSAMTTHRIPLSWRALAVPRRFVCAAGQVCVQHDLILISERQETFSSQASKSGKRGLSLAQLAKQSMRSNCSEQRLHLANQRNPERESALGRLIEAAQ
jgi:hypothetical protein